VQYLRILIGGAIIGVVLLFLMRPAQPNAVYNRVSYDGEILQLNDRSVDEIDLLEMEFPDEAKVQLNLSDIKHTNLGAKSGLINEWNKKGIDYYYAVDGVPVTVNQLSWRPATSTELREEIYEENRRRAAVAEARRATKRKQQQQSQPAMITMETPPPVTTSDAPDYEEYVPTDKNRYLWNGEEIGTAAEAEEYLSKVRLIPPGALLVLVPKGDAPPDDATEIADLGFEPVVMDLLKRASDARIYVRVHRGEGFPPARGTREAVNVFGGLFFAYLGPIVLMLIAVFIATWFLEGGRADHEA